MLKILSWNIRQGGGSRSQGILNAIQKIDPQILALNEWRNNSASIQMRYALLRQGYLHQFTPNSPSNYNSVFLASKFDFATSLYKTEDANYPYNIICGHFDAFEVFSVYLPHKKKHQLFPVLIEEVKSRPLPSIIVGDYNTGHNFIDQKGNSFWYEAELQQLESENMVDAFRHVHKDKKDYSWYSHQGNGFRYDHTYVEDTLCPWISGCRYLHEYREDKLSDHSPMLLVLNVE